MNTISSKTPSIIGTISIILAAVLILFAPTLVGSQTTQDDLIQQINEMKQQVNQLQEQIVNQSRSGDDLSSSSSISVNQQSTINSNAVDNFQPFTQNLSRGDRGAEVRRLQQVLNQLLPTPVAATGPGSIGQETDFYGPATAAAISRFQEIHAEDVLAPVDLQQGTGYLGNSTRAKLNHLLVLEARNAGDGAVAVSSLDSDGQNVDNILRDDEVDDEIAELETRVNLDKWDLTENEKRQIAMSVPEEIRGDFFPDYVGSSNTNDPRNDDGDDTYDNPLQQEYQRRLELQSSAVDMLRDMSKSYVTEPLQRLQHSLAQVFGPAETANAQLGLVFGGRVGAVIPCTCNPPAVHFTVIGARPASSVYFPGVTQKSPPTPPLPGAGTLGNYTPFGICLVGVPPACAPTPAFGTAVIMGTSY